MAFISKFGTIWGIPPETGGRVFFVAPSSPYYVDGRAYDASDSTNDGLSPERALATISRALTLAGVSSGNPIDTGGSITSTTTGDTICLLPGTHTATALLRVQAAGVRLIGLPVPVRVPAGPSNRKPAAVITTSASAPLLSIEASNVTVGNVTLRPITGYGTVVFAGNPTVDNLHIHDVHLDLTGSDPDTYGIDFAYRTSTLTAESGSYSTKAGTHAAASTVVATAYIERLYALARGTVGPAIETATANVVVKDSWFHNSSGAWAQAIAVATSTRDSRISGCVFTTTGTMTACINGTNANVNLGVWIHDNRFPSATQSVAIEGFAAPGTEAMLTENYAAGQGSGAGGSLVTTAT